VRRTPREKRIRALQNALVNDHSFEASHSLRVATHIVNQVRSAIHLPLVAVFSRNPSISPVVVPVGYLPATDVVVMIPLAQLFAGLGDVRV